MAERLKLVYLNIIFLISYYHYLLGKFTKWQVYHTPPGFASTANPCESFNGKLKEIFTSRELLNMETFLTIALDELCPFYSLNHRDFLFYRLPDKKCREASNSLDVKNFTRVNETTVYYQGKSRIYQIDFNTNACTCRFYIAYAICAHIYVACKHFNRALNGCINHRNYTYRSKRGAKPKAKPASQYLLTVPVSQKRGSDDLNDESSDDCGDNGADGQPVSKKSRTQPKPEQQGAKTKRGRGRSRLTEAEKASRKATGGRPKKAAKALTVD